MSAPIRIVATGDSMTETAGAGCPALAEELARVYPGVAVELINHGVGGTRVGYGLWRLTHAYAHRDKQWPPLVSLDPDIVLLESFAYNNGSYGVRDDGLAHFREMHRQIVGTLRERTRARVVFVVTIAPDLDRFLETVPAFFHTPLSIRRWMAEDRVRYLEAAVQLAQELDLPLANAYQASLEAEKTGTRRSTFIDPDEWIHPGPAGHRLVARTIGQTLQAHRLMESVRAQRVPQQRQTPPTSYRSPRHDHPVSR